MNPSCGKLHFWGTSDAFLMPGCVILLGINCGKEAKGTKKGEKAQPWDSCHVLLTSHLVHQDA